MCNVEAQARGFLLFRCPDDQGSLNADAECVNVTGNTWELYDNCARVLSDSNGRVYWLVGCQRPMRPDFLGGALHIVQRFHSDSREIWLRKLQIGFQQIKQFGKQLAVGEYLLNVLNSCRLELAKVTSALRDILCCWSEEKIG